MKKQSAKKTFLKNVTHCKSGDCIQDFVFEFKSFFQVARHNRSKIALQYIKGLITLEKGKANMERMEEEIPDSEYRAYQHFISNSSWDYKGAISELARQACQLMQESKKETSCPTGLIFDESAHVKKGDKSVGVSRQYAGVVGKVENAQVGVYASLVNDIRSCLINERLFLPKKWVEDSSRCLDADIPKKDITFKTKPQLALEMVDQAISQGISFDWIGGDGLYGHNSELRKGLEKRGLFYVLDVHKDEKVFTEKPIFKVPAKTKKRGRPSNKPKPHIEPVRLDTYQKQLSQDDWKVESHIRKTHKGWKKVKVHKSKVWICEDNQTLSEYTLVITQSVDGKKETKYSLSNGDFEQYSTEEYAYFQCQRYWVERAFDDLKNELGMSDYQIRKWKGWHHHHTLVFMAGLYLLKQRIDAKAEFPLMSTRDARILMIVSLFGTKKEVEKRIKQMKERHRKIQADIDRYYQQT